MCGRVSILSSAEELARRYGTVWLPRLGSGVLLPGGEVPVLVGSLAGGRDWVYPVWGMDVGGRLVYNARSESIGEKVLFRRAWESGQRGVLPVSEFYERDGYGRLYRVRPVDGGLLNLGVLYLGRPFVGFVLTTEANDQLRRIHHRQPLVVGDGDLGRWLDFRVSGRELGDLLSPYCGGFEVVRV
jgi:putative SOS response-associated peptidase YedK